MNRFTVIGLFGLFGLILATSACEKPASAVAKAQTFAPPRGAAAPRKSSLGGSKPARAITSESLFIAKNCSNDGTVKSAVCARPGPFADLFPRTFWPCSACTTSRT